MACSALHRLLRWKMRVMDMTLSQKDSSLSVISLPHVHMPTCSISSSNFADLPLQLREAFAQSGGNHLATADKEMANHIREASCVRSLALYSASSVLSATPKQQHTLARRLYLCCTCSYASSATLRGYKPCADQCSCTLGHNACYKALICGPC